MIHGVPSNVCFFTCFSIPGDTFCHNHVFVFPVTVLKVYGYKMEDEQKDWWAGLIESIKEDARTKCGLCFEYRSKIQATCVDMAAANRAGNKDEFNAKRREKTGIEKELHVHVTTVNHGQYDIPIVTPLLQRLRFQSPGVTAADDAPMELCVGTDDERERPAPASPAPRPAAPVVAGDSNRWPCFGGRPKPLVSSSGVPKRLRNGTPGLEVGDMAVVRVEPDDQWSLPFKVGEVLSVDEAQEEVKLALYGNTKANANGVFTKGKWHEASKTISWSKNKPRGGGYSDYELVCEPDCFVDWGFKLRKNGMLPKAVKDVIVHNKRVPWGPT